MEMEMIIYAAELSLEAEDRDTPRLRCVSDKSFYIKHLDIDLCLTCGRIHGSKPKIKTTKRLPMINQDPDPMRIYP